MPFYLYMSAYVSQLSIGDDKVTETADAKVTLVADGYLFTEGPAVDSDGVVFFTDQPNDRILKVDLEGKVTEYMKPAGRSNGMFFAIADRMV